MNSSSNIDSNYSLQNIDNFKSNLTVSPNFIIEKYIHLVIEYLNYIIETHKIKNKQISIFIVVRGLETLTNVFFHILYYTKNLDLTYFHSQKGYYYYIEFVEQITEAHHSFLQLTSRDATIYVYKKTIYEINNDVRKNKKKNTEPIMTFDLVTEYIKIFKTIIYNFLNNCAGGLENNKDNIVNLESVFAKLNSLDMELENVIEFGSFINLLSNKCVTCDKFMEIIHLLIKKINKNMNVICHLKEKKHSNDFVIKLDEPVSKFIAWLTEK
jgi:hypothetical protein